jgi:hypothetical protein
LEKSAGNLARVIQFFAVGLLCACSVNFNRSRGPSEIPCSSHGSQIFDYAGNEVSFSPVLHCERLTVLVWGAGGGGAGPSAGLIAYSGGGAGAVSAVLATKPGDQIRLIVGGGGSVGGVNSVAFAVNPGGFGGGGAGHASQGGGGGRSAILVNGVEVLTAGGGGGGGTSIVTTRNGGAGGGPSGEPGLGNDSISGKGATSDQGGAGGINSLLNTGSPGAQGQGGDGNLSYGAGGGAGFFGGGGATTEINDAGGGGGGSGYASGTGVDSALMSAGTGVLPGDALNPQRGSAGEGGPGLMAGSPGRIVIAW